MGYTPTLSTAVFMGFDPPAPNGQKYTVKGRALTGGSFPASAWQRFMKAALEGVPVTDFSEPAPIRKPASEELQRERRGFAPGAPSSRGGHRCGRPLRVQPRGARRAGPDHDHDVHQLHVDHLDHVDHHDSPAAGFRPSTDLEPGQPVSDEGHCTTSAHASRTGIPKYTVSGTKPSGA